MAIVLALLLLLLAASPGLAQNNALVAMPTNPVVIQPDLYSAIWNYLVQTECRNPLQLLNQLQQAKQLTEPRKMPDPGAPVEKK